MASSQLFETHAGPSTRASEAWQAAGVVKWPHNAQSAIAAGVHAAADAHMAARPPEQALLTEQQPPGTPQCQRQASGRPVHCLYSSVSLILLLLWQTTLCAPSTCPWTGVHAAVKARMAAGGTAIHPEQPPCGAPHRQRLASCPSNGWSGNFWRCIGDRPAVHGANVLSVVSTCREGGGMQQARNAQ